MNEGLEEHIISDTDSDITHQSAPFLIQMEDYEGPLDLLLDLSRKKKFDLAKISIAELARQYIRFIETAQRLKIEVAADYLVMATYLAWLKSRLLTHDEDDDEEETLSPELQAENLRLRLLHLEQIKIRADQLMARLQIGRDVFKNGKPEHMGVREQAKYDASLLELLRAYGDITMRSQTGEFKIIPSRLFSPEQMYQRLNLTIGTDKTWQDIKKFMPDCTETLLKKSALSGLLVAGLQLTKEGKIDMQQAQEFAPIYIRAV